MRALLIDDDDNDDDGIDDDDATKFVFCPQRSGRDGFCRMFTAGYGVQ